MASFPNIEVYIVNTKCIRTFLWYNDAIIVWSTRCCTFLANKKGTNKKTVYNTFKSAPDSYFVHQAIFYEEIQHDFNILKTTSRIRKVAIYIPPKRGKWKTVVKN